MCTAYTVKVHVVQCTIRGTSALLVLCPLLSTRTFVSNNESCVALLVFVVAKMFCIDRQVWPNFPTPHTTQVHNYTPSDKAVR